MQEQQKILAGLLIALGVLFLVGSVKAYDVGCVSTSTEAAAADGYSNFFFDSDTVPIGFNSLNPSSTIPYFDQAYKVPCPSIVDYSQLTNQLSLNQGEFNLFAGFIILLGTFSFLYNFLKPIK